MRREGPLRVLRGADADAYETGVMSRCTSSDDDEGLPPHRLRARRQDLLQRRLRKHQELSTNSASTSTTVGRSYTKSNRARVAARRDHPDLRLPRNTAPSWPWSIRQGIHQLSFASDVIVDASMPAMIRAGGKMWAPTDGQKEPRRQPRVHVSRIYQKIINFCKTHGQFDPTTMARFQRRSDGAAGRRVRSHDKTFEIPRTGRQHRRPDTGDVLLRKTWKPATSGACPSSGERSATGSSWPSPGRELGHAVVFCWTRSVARKRIAHEGEHLPRRSRHRGLDIQSCRRTGPCAQRSSERCVGRTPLPPRATILRDYLTDLFPILELGTSAKMLFNRAVDGPAAE